MTVQINISQIEDQVINPLNNILMLCIENDNYGDVEKEISRVIATLERERLINKRIRCH